jgi:hypothetical protein
VPIHFAKNNQGSMFVFIGNDDKTVAPPGVYNIPLQGKNAHIQIEVGAYGWLIPTNMREQWKPLCLANHDLPANIPPFDVAAYGNAPIWVCAIEDGKYTDQWYLVQPKRDTENNLSLTCIGSNKAGIPLPSGNYICPNGNAPFRMAISANNGHVDDFRIIPSDAKQLNPGTLHSSDYTTIITNKEICAIPIKKVANDAFRYDRNDASMFEINGNTITSTNNVCLPNRLYLLADSKTRTTVYGWIDVLDEGVINNTSQQNTQPQPQNTPQPLNQNSSQVIPPPSQLDANSSQNTSPPK